MILASTVLVYELTEDEKVDENIALLPSKDYVWTASKVAVELNR